MDNFYSPDCISWYIADTVYAISNSLARSKIKIEKDRGKHSTFQEMIQTINNP
jgi:hypothetical protein